MTFSNFSKVQTVVCEKCNVNTSSLEIVQFRHLLLSLTSIKPEDFLNMEFSFLKHDLTPESQFLASQHLAAIWHGTDLNF